MNKIITRNQIKTRLNNGEPTILVEALPKKYFDEAHLPGAINIPHDEIREKAPHLIRDKDAVIVVYCANTECRNSHIATKILQQMGYRNVFEYVEGKQHWLEADLPLESAA